MSATYENARETLDAARTDLDAAAEGADPIPFAAAVAQVGTGEAILALAEEVEALVELLRERLPAPESTVDPDPDLGIGVCDVCETGVFPGQSVATTPDGGLRHGWCQPSTAPSLEELEAMGPRCVTCSIRRDLHRADLGHPWNGGGSA